MTPYEKQIEINKYRKLIDSGKLTEAQKEEFRKRIRLLKPKRLRKNENI